MHSFVVHYARRLIANDNPPPFEDEDENTWWRDAHDDQQQIFHIIESRSESLDLSDETGLRIKLGLPWRARTNGLRRPKGNLPEGLNPQQVSYECFLEHQDSAEWTAARVLISLDEQTYLRDESNTILFQALPGPLEVAEFDKQALDAYDAVPDPFDIRQQLETIGFEPMRLFLPEDPGKDAAQELWSRKLGFTTYLPLEGFFHASALQETQSHGVTTTDYDAYHLMPIAVTLPDGCATHIEYNYHSLLPRKKSSTPTTISKRRFMARTACPWLSPFTAPRMALRRVSIPSILMSRPKTCLPLTPLKIRRTPWATWPAPYGSKI
nr:hypothetical protein GCM10020185_51620 [Pseudomonas brassicacearum subsp. brassicacearum]